MFVLLVYMSVHGLLSLCPWRTEDCIGSPRIRVTESYEPPCRYFESNLGPCKSKCSQMLNLLSKPWEESLNKEFSQVSLWKCLWAIFLVFNRCRGACPLWAKPFPRQEGLFLLSFFETGSLYSPGSCI